MKDPKEGVPEGLKLESAASITLRETIGRHMKFFSPLVRRDRVTSQSVVAAYIDGLAGAMSLSIAGRHGSYEEVWASTMTELRKAVDRDLRHLGAQRHDT